MALLGEVKEHDLLMFGEEEKAFQQDQQALTPRGVTAVFLLRTSG